MIAVAAILFDLDGTLVDSKKDIALSVHYLQEKYGRPMSPKKRSRGSSAMGWGNWWNVRSAPQP